MADVNLTHGTCSDASTAWGFVNPSYVNDGNTGTAATAGWDYNAGATGYIRIKTDLGVVCTVASSYQERSSGTTSDAFATALEYSDDGSTWHDSGASYADTTPGAGVYRRTWTLPVPISARYWRTVAVVPNGFVIDYVVRTWSITGDVYVPPPPGPPSLTIGGVEIERPLEHRVRVELNAAGSGYLRIAKSDVQATEAILVRGATCAFTVPEIHSEPIFEWILQDGDFELIGSAEGAEVLAFSGPGTLSYLARAVLDYVEYEDGIGTVKLSRGIWQFDESNTEGQIINKLVKEAQSASRPSDPIPLVTKTFNATTDSNGTAWADQTLEGKWREKIGTNLLSAILRLVRAGLLSIEMAPGYELNCYRSVGRDLTGTAFGAGVVRFAAGVNIAAELSRSMAGISFATHGIVRYGDGSYTRAVKDGGLPYDQEAYFESNADKAVTARRQAKGQMKLREDAQESLIFSHVVPWPGAGSVEGSGIYLPGPAWSDNGLYWVGDLVTLHTGTSDWEYDNADQRVYAITLGTDVTGHLAPPIVELNAPYRRKNVSGELGAVTGGSGDITIIGGSGVASTETVAPRWKDPVRVVVTTNVTISTGLNAGDSAGGVTLAAGDRVLLVGQTDAEDNGIYQAGTSPSRTSDFDAGDEIPGAVVVVLEGTDAGTSWRCTNATEPVVGTDAIDWERFGAGALDDLADVDTTGVADGDTLVYDLASTSWIPGAVSGGGATAFIGCALTKSATQSIAASAATAVTFDSEDFDTDGFHSTSANTERLTIPAGLGGKYLLTGSAELAALADQKDIIVRFRVNGTTYIQGRARTHASGTSYVAPSHAVSVSLAAGDYVEMVVEHSDTVARDVRATADGTSFSIVKLDSGKVGQGIGARVYRSTNQTISSSSETAIAFDSEDFDTDGFHSTSANTERFTIPTGLGGKYLIGANLYLGSITAGNYIAPRIRKNGSTPLAATRVGNSPDGNELPLIVTVADLAAGDYVECTIQSADSSYTVLPSGSALPQFWIMRMDSGSGVQSISGAYSGYNTAGGSWLNMNGAYAKKVTLTDGLVLNIAAYVKGNATNAGSFGAALLSDNAGVPGLMVARGAGSAVDYSGAANHDFTTAMHATGRWLQVPINAYVTAGDYWLVVFGGRGSNNGGSQLAYDGSGSDYTHTAGWPFDGQFSAYTSGSNKFSIRALTTRMSVS